MTRRSRAYLALAGLPLLLVAVGCSDADNDGDDSTFADDGDVPAETVEAQLEGFLADAGVTGATELSCDGVEDKVDATTTCTLTLEGEELEVPVRVAASDATSVTFEFDGAALGLG